jgi:hypothetical protein
MMPRTLPARLYYGSSCHRAALTAHPFQPFLFHETF